MPEKCATNKRSRTTAFGNTETTEYTVAPVKCPYCGNKIKAGAHVGSQPHVTMQTVSIDTTVTPMAIGMVEEIKGAVFCPKCHRSFPLNCADPA